MVDEKELIALRARVAELEQLVKMQAGRLLVDATRIESRAIRNLHDALNRAVAEGHQLKRERDQAGLKLREAKHLLVFAVLANHSMPGWIKTKIVAFLCRGLMDTQPRRA